jgi:predicted ATPase/DNA-binding CsgD family transcriptional regulator
MALAGAVTRDPVTRRLHDWPDGVPAPLTAFIGRERELAEVARLLTAERLVTLTGAGGVGKTRLAIEAAVSVRPAFPDGVDLIDLSAVTAPALIATAIAAALGIEERTGAANSDRLAAVLRPQRRLLVLDNCEHLRDGSADLATRLLSLCPHVTVLTTSRESLAVPGEVTWRVPSLTFPWPEHLPVLSALENFEAAALFLARARASSPGLELAPSDVAAVASICFQLDGIPLALELAAARAGAMSLQAIAERLTGSFELLARSGGGPTRHQTLRASVEWSHQLLAEDERALLSRLTVFAGGWTLDAAEVVCSGPPVGPGQVARLLAALVDKSLVQAELAGPHTRYRLLEVIRAFAAQRQAGSAELDELRARHGEYFAALGERSAPLFIGPDQGDWARRIDQETENLRAARRWCEESEDRAELGLRLASGLWEYWHIRGRLDEGARWLEDALNRTSEPAAARAGAVNGLGVIEMLRGKLDHGLDLFRQSVEEYARLGDLRGQSRALTHYGNGLALTGDASGAARVFAEAKTAAARSGDDWYIAFALYLASWAASIHGDTSLMRSQAQECCRLFASKGDRRGVAYALNSLADALIRDGQAEQAMPKLRDSIAIFDALPERWGLLVAMDVLAEATAALGDWSRFATVLGIIGSLSERIGGQLFPHQVAALERLAALAAAELGAAFAPARQAGEAIGRSDGIAAALWPDQSGPAACAGAQRPPLTRRESEIADLITEGMTNRQIASRLFISERTADTHVGRILAKLGCTSRAQVAAIIATSRARLGPRDG